MAKKRQHETILTDTVGVAVPIPEGEKAPKVGTFVEVRVGRKRFELVVKSIYKKKNGSFMAWCFLQKGKGDGAAFRSCRLKKAIILY